MNSETFVLPMMYGDHHVLEVRQLLNSLPGIENVYASSSFQIVEVTYDEAQVNKETIQSTLGDAGYLEDLVIPIEIGSSPAHENGRPFFRHTAVFAQTGQSISFTQDVPEVERPLWPCPGLKQ
jgi:copper chaperone CopZ